ncbi:tudor domain-containing protein 7A isoform X1 [Microplitis demolitor]|uniref:tudor domain-containing protein 7A isoform X1 n=1 Tax=Microplitis demolitor TaxID=69319 RepID=UPI0004CDD2AC|nr:tudor domain-containing protein 7A isoform X1 [Microplitis demolitor]XP_008544774.1 tudor domain-containing protein 7A isoform X1 [Microplitis demolitor]
MEDVGRTIRSLLLASKEGVAIDNVNRDYKAMEGDYIPFRKYGYLTVHEFLKAVPNIRIVSKNGTFFAQAVANANNRHIADLVSKQKTPRVRPTSSRRPKNTYSYKRSASSNRFSPRSNSFAGTGRTQSLHRSASLSNDSSRNWAPRQENNIRPLMPVSTSSTNFNGNSNSSSQRKSERPEADKVFQQPRVNGFQQNSSFSSTAASSSSINSRPGTLSNISLGKHSQPQNLASTVTRQNSFGDNRSMQPTQIPPLIPPTDRKSPVSPSGPAKQKQLSPSSNYSGLNNSSKTNGTMYSDHVPPLKPLSERLKNPLAFSTAVPVTDYSKPSAADSPTSADKRVTFAPTVRVKTPPLVLRQPSSDFAVSSKQLTPPDTPKKNNDLRDDLVELVEKLHLPKPEYFIKQSGKHNQKTILCQIKIGGVKFSSYPYDAKTQKEAEIAAAEQALADLKQHYETSVGLPITYDKELIKQRVIAIVDSEDHKSGIFKHKLPFYYKDKYNEALPNNWDTIINECSSKLVCEKAAGDEIILLPYDPVADNFEPKMPELILPQEDLWPVYVTNLVTTDEVYGIILEDEFCSKRDVMSEKLDGFYSKVRPKPPSIKVNRYYALKKDDSWHRVFVEYIDNEINCADIFFIDTGDMESVSFNDLCALDKSFYELAPQAVRFSIAGYEELSNYETINKIGEKLLTNLSCYVQVLSREKNDMGLVINGVFFDTSTADDINVNELILEKLTSFVSSPQLTIEGEVLEVYLSHVDEAGGYIQINDDSHKILVALIDKLTSESINEDALKRATVSWNAVNRESIYLIHLPDGQWVRVKVIQPVQNNQLSVMLIDVGKKMIVNASELLKTTMIPAPHDNNLKLIASAIEKYPVQACKIQLHNTRTSVLNDKKFLEPLIEMAPPNAKLFCKVIKETKESSPLAVVELFKRNESDNLLISINNSLVMRPNNKAGDEDKNNNMKKRLEKKNSRSSISRNGLELLGQPKIPDVGKYFDVHVTRTVTGPNHFVVQPYDGTEPLAIMEKRLQLYCEDNSNFVPPDDFYAVGNLCAANVSQKWYRALIVGPFDSYSTIVYLCDSGVMHNVPNTNLKPLADEFLTISYQGIKAKLYGAESFDWKAHHDSKFKELVADKDFVSVVRKIESDKSSQTNQIICLELVDTSGSTDKNILEEVMSFDK